MIIVINDNSKQDYNNIQQQYNTVIQFYKSSQDLRGMQYYFQFFTESKKYINDVNVLFIVINMNSQTGRQFASYRNIYGVPSLLIYKNGIIYKQFGGLPVLIDNDSQFIQQLNNSIIDGINSSV